MVVREVTDERERSKLWQSECEHPPYEDYQAKTEKFSTGGYHQRTLIGTQTAKVFSGTGDQQQRQRVTESYASMVLGGDARNVLNSSALILRG